MFGEYYSHRITERHQDTIRDCSCILSSQQAPAMIYSGKFIGVMEREKKKEQRKLLVPELLCLHIGSRSFLDATCKILWISHDVSFPLAQHNVPCTHPFYYSWLIFSSSLFWHPSMSMIDQTSLNRMSMCSFLLINAYSCDPACLGELRYHLVLASRGHSFSKRQNAPWKLIQCTLI